MIAEIECAPAEELQIRQRYGVASDRAREAERRWFHKNIEANPEVHRKWRALVDRYKLALRGGSPSR